MPALLVIDHVFKRQMDAFWDRIGAPLARAGVSPNAVTLTSVVLVCTSAAALVWHRSFFAFGVSLALFELLDNIDGAVARVAGKSSRAGAFLDATTDRFKEMAALTAVACVSGAYLPAMLALGGGMSVSYNVARAKAEGAQALRGLPPLFERLERVALLCTALILSPWVPSLWGQPFLVVCLWILVQGYAALT
jgi:CDP-diacylglycerol--glycerol-3-phosphate 3-phosphatidyltransferase